MIKAIMCNNDKMVISNRDLNEIANYMKLTGHTFIAEHDIIPIVLKTAGEKRATAIIKDKKIQSHINYFVNAMANETSLIAG